MKSAPFYEQLSEGDGTKGMVRGSWRLDYMYGGLTDQTIKLQVVERIVCVMCAIGRED
jgi:hypothetical protein